MVYPDGTEEPVDCYLKNSDVIGKTGKQIYVEHTNEKECIWCGLRGLFRRQFLIENRLSFDPECHYGEDEKFMVQVFFHAEKILSNEFVGYYYRANRSGSLMTTFKISQAVEQAKVYREWKAWIESNDKDEDVKFFKALSFELKRRVWGLYLRCSFGTIANKKDRKLWYRTLRANKLLFEQSADKYAKGRMHKLIKILGIARATSLMSMIISLKKRLRLRKINA